MDFSSPIQIILYSLALLFLYALWRKITKKTTKTKKFKVPEPSGSWPLIGHLHLLTGQKPACKILASIADESGPFYSLRLGFNRILVVSSWEFAKECFTKNDRVLATRASIAAGKYMGYNNAVFSLAPYGQYWRDIRKLATLQLLSNNRLEALKHVRFSEIDLFLKEIHIYIQYFNYVNDEKDEKGGKRIGKLMKEFMYVSGLFVPSDVFPFLWWMNFLGPAKTMKRLSKELDSLLQTWIDEHKLKRINQIRDDGDCKSIEKEDFIDVMLSVLEDDFFGHLGKTSLKEQSLHALELAQQELDLKVGRERCVQDSDIEKLVYLQAVIKETLRLYPPGPLAVPHEAVEDCYISRYYIPKGTRIFANLWKLHRDPNVWSNPDEFLPERFLANEGKNVDFSGQNFEYIPFGSGRRSCPGINFAIQAIQMTVARLLQAFSFTTPFGQAVDMTHEGIGITLPKATPLEIQITPRLSSELYEY
ncbi:hypothetical protein JCGZ_15165 [Jatropha curcas]|uniref:Cytochrome P450 n=1 Tax=Jatropha curcas TaxID=180498 RepID=A0A067LKS7_JATCU|nr:hypothetical protein JCGZ_15165 [Jatropha curcas]